MLLPSMPHLLVDYQLSILEQCTAWCTRIAARNPTIFLVGILFACDETKLQKESKARSWPLMFTVSILNKKMRNLPIAWKSLG
jgi:hypothetical protein